MSGIGGRLSYSKEGKKGSIGEWKGWKGRLGKERRGGKERD